MPKGIFKYDYHFIMKELAEEFEDNLLVSEKYWKIHNLFISNKKELTIINKKGKEITKTISYRLQTISYRLHVNL